MKLTANDFQNFLVNLSVCRQNIKVIRALQRIVNWILRKGEKYVEGQLKQISIIPTTLKVFLPELI